MKRNFEHYVLARTLMKTLIIGASIYHMGQTKLKKFYVVKKPKRSEVNQC